MTGALMGQLLQLEGPGHHLDILSIPLLSIPNVTATSHGQLYQFHVIHYVYHHHCLRNWCNTTTTTILTAVYWVYPG